MDTLGIIKYRDFILQKCAELYTGDYYVVIVGSRIRNDWTEESDFDIVMAVRDDLAFQSYGRVESDGDKFTFSRVGEQFVGVYRGFNVSWYNLETEELHIGPDEEALRIFKEGLSASAVKTKLLAILPASVLTFEDQRQNYINQMSAEVCAVLTASDWGEIRQADPTEPTRMSDEEFFAYREKRKAIRKFFEDYKVAMLLLTDMNAVLIFHKTKLIELELLK